MMGNTRLAPSATWLPLAYAMACVEVVSNKSKRVGGIYSQIVEDWGKPWVKALFNDLCSELPEVKIVLIFVEKRNRKSKSLPQN